MFWDWEELISTYSFDQQSRIRIALSGASIHYKLKTINRTSPDAFAPSRRSYTGTVGEGASMYAYVFYVQHKDYELATHLLPVS